MLLVLVVHNQPKHTNNANPANVTNKRRLAIAICWLAVFIVVFIIARSPSSVGSVVWFHVAPLGRLCRVNCATRETLVVVSASARALRVPHLHSWYMREYNTVPRARKSQMQTIQQFQYGGGPLIIVPHGSSPWHSPPTAVATHFTCRHTDKLAVSRHDPVNRRPCPRVIGFPAKFRTEPGWLPFEPFFLCVCYSAVFTMHLVRSCWIKAILLTSPSLDWISLPTWLINKSCKTNENAGFAL